MKSTLFTEVERLKTRTVNSMLGSAERLRNQGLAGVAETLEAGCRELKHFHFNVAIIGSVSRGKSTLLNTLLGQRDDQCSPIAAATCTGAIVRYLDLSCAEGESEPHALVYYRGQSEPEHIELSTLRHYISNSTNPNNELGIDHIEVYGNFPLLHSCSVVDTPGTDAIEDSHGAMVQNYLPQADAVIMMLDANSVMDSEDQRWLRLFSQDTQRKVFYCVNKIDEAALTPAAMQETRSRIVDKATAAGLAIPRNIYFMAADPVYQTLRNGSSQNELEQQKQQWGLSHFERDLETFIMAHSEPYRELKQRLLRILDAATRSLKSRREDNSRILRAKQEERGTLENELRQLSEQLDKSEAKVREEVEEFRRMVALISRRRLGQLDELTSDISADIQRIVREQGLLESISGLFSWQKKLDQLISPRLSRYVLDLQDAVDKQMQGLQERLQDEISLHKSNMNWAADGVAVAGGLGVGTVAALSLGNAALDIWALQPVFCAATHASTAAAAAASQTGAVAGFWGWLFGAQSTSSTAVASAAASKASLAWGVFYSSVSACIAPVVLAVLATYGGAWFARRLTEKRMQQNIRKALEETRASLEQQLRTGCDAVEERAMELSREACRRNKQEIEALNDKLSRVQTEEGREQLEKENAVLGTILAELDGMMQEATLA